MHVNLLSSRVMMKLFLLLSDLILIVFVTVVGAPAASASNTEQ